MAPSLTARRYRITNFQKESLLLYVLEHPETMSVRMHWTQTQYDDTWRKAANDLNHKHSIDKSWKQWKKTWQDLKSMIKKRHHYEQRQPRTADNNPLILLSPLERSVIAKIDKYTSIRLNSMPSTSNHVTASNPNGSSNLTAAAPSPSSPLMFDVKNESTSPRQGDDVHLDSSVEYLLLFFS